MKPATAKKLLTKVRDDYNAIAEDFSVTRIYPWPEFAILEKYIKNKNKILDIGCGNGRLCESFKTKNIYYTGVDNSEKLIIKAQQRYPSQFFQVGDMLDLPFADQEFDAALAIAVLNHIPSNELRSQALAEVHRILKPSAYFLMTNWNLYQSKYKNLLKKSDDMDEGDALVPWKSPDGKLLQKRYYHSFTLEELEELANKNNFKIIKQYYSLKGDKTSKDKAFNTLSIWQKI